MSIDDLAVSLLGRKEKREQEYDRQARKAEKRQRIVAGLGLGVNLINRRLAKRTQEFMNSEPVLQQRLLYRQSVDNKKELDGTYSKIMESGKGTHQYFSDDSYSTVYDNIKKKLASEGKNTDEKSMARYESLIMDQAKTLGQERATAFDAAYQDSRSVGSMKDYDRMIALRNKKPVNLAQWFGMRLKGKTAEDLDNETLASIKNSPLSKYSQEFKDSYESLYKGTKDSAFAFDAAQINIKPDPSIDKWSEKKQEAKTVSNIYGGQSIEVVETEYFYDRNSEAYKRDGSPYKSEIVLNEDGSEARVGSSNPEYERKIVASLRSTFDFIDKAKGSFTGEGVAAYYAEAKQLAQKAGIKDFEPANVKTIQEYNILAKAWTNLMSKDYDEGIIKDPDRVEYTSSIISNIAQNPIMFANLTEILEMKEGPQKNKRMQTWQNELASFIGLLNSATQTDGAVKSFKSSKPEYDVITNPDEAVPFPIGKVFSYGGKLYKKVRGGFDPYTEGSD